MSAQHINNPEVVGIFGIIVISAIVLLCLIEWTKNRITQAHAKRRQHLIYKAAKEARRDFRQGSR